MNEKIISFIKDVLAVMPDDWQRLTTHRLDLYKEELAKVEFLDQFENLFAGDHGDKIELKEALTKLPTAFDYIRLGHPLSCVLEWAIAKSKDQNIVNVISFSSQTMPILAILRKNSLDNINTQIVYDKKLPMCFDAEILKSVYGYKFDLIQKNSRSLDFNGMTIALTEFNDRFEFELDNGTDFLISTHPEFGSITIVNKERGEGHISEILHVRRRESIAMTPADCLIVLNKIIGQQSSDIDTDLRKKNKALAIRTIKDITRTSTDASIGSSGLSIQYAIMMGLIHSSMDEYQGKDIKFIVPPNCYGGTNDQARRVAACIKNVEIVDLPVDGGQDMVQSIEKVLDLVAKEDALPFIIAEIPTNPRVEVPNLEKLRDVLAKERRTKDGDIAISPVFILDQTFCPNMKFLGAGDILSSVKTISYVSGSKFPSGGLCTAGYCVANTKAEKLMSYVDVHLKLCGNEATAFQIEILAKQMPSMLQRIDGAYKKTREFVNHIFETLPEAKINFVSSELAEIGFTPSVFSLDLPVKGSSDMERESHKRELNSQLINLMISEIPNESKHCVSYGQLKGCYWTIPATSTQGTTKEGDKDYIVRVSVSPVFDLELHKSVFSRFCDEFINK